jgi:hypothetical protein
MSAIIPDGHEPRKSKIRVDRSHFVKLATAPSSQVYGYGQTKAAMHPTNAELLHLFYRNMNVVAKDLYFYVPNVGFLCVPDFCFCDHFIYWTSELVHDERVAH